MTAAAPTIAERRVALEGRLEGLRNDLAASLIDGTEFDASSIAALETELDGLRRAEGLAEQREREAQAERDEERRRELGADYAVADAERVAAIAGAEAATKAFVKHVRAAIEAGQRMARVRGELGVSAWWPLLPADTARLFSIHWSAEVGGLVHPAKFGALVLKMPPLPSSKPWAERDGFAAPPINTEKSDAA